MRPRGPALAVLLAASLSVATAQEPVTLPGGASALTETHGDWVVRCEVSQQQVGCSLVQEQFDPNSRQRVLAIELAAVDGTLRGSLVLPFGLALERGVVLQVDEQQPLPVLAFRTCLPAGCLVDVGFSPDVLASLRSGTALKAVATADGGAAAPFSLPLGGFSSALDRAIALGAQ